MALFKISSSEMTIHAEDEFAPSLAAGGSIGQTSIHLTPHLLFSLD